MALTGFSSLGQATNRGSLAGFSSLGSLSDVAATPEPDRGFFGSLLHEIGLDLKGAAKFSASIPFSAAEFLGAQVPFSFDDLTKRDFTGAAMVGSMFVGGIAAQGAKGVKAGVGALKAQRLIGTAAARAETAEFAKTLTFLQSLAITAGAEATAGASFGLLKPLEDADSRLEAMLVDTALFAGLGAGFNVIGQGFKATIGAKRAQLARQAATVKSMHIARRAETEVVLSEYAGKKFWNPETLRVIDVRRAADGSARLVHANGVLDPHKFLDSEGQSGFEAAMVEVISAGYTSPMGTSRLDIRQPLEDLLAKGADLDPEIVARLQNGEKLNDIIGKLNISNYKDFISILDEKGFADRQLTSLEAEVLHYNGTDTNPINLESSLVSSIRDTLPPASWRTMKDFVDPETGLIKNGQDAEFLREAIKHGAVSVEGLVDANAQRDWVKELVINGGNLGDRPILVAQSSLDAGVEARLMSTRWLEKFHPEIKPATDILHRVANEGATGTSAHEAFYTQVSGAVSNDTMFAASDLLESVAKPNWLETATEAVLRAKATGKKDLIAATEHLTDTITRQNLRFIVKGMKGVSNAAPEIVASVRKKLAAYIAKDAKSVASFDVQELYRSFGETKPQKAVLNREERAAFAELTESANWHGWSEREQSLSGWHVKGEGINERFSTFDEAMQGATDSTAEGVLQVFPQQSVNSSAASKLSTKDLMRLKARELKAAGIELTPNMRQAIRSTSVKQQFANQFRNRVSLRDITDDPFKALDYWSTGAEHAMAYSEIASKDFSSLVNSIVPAEKKHLIATLMNKRDIMLGNPTKMEEAFEKTWEQLFPEVSAPNVRKTSAAIRRWQGYSKLGGAWSGIVNIFQTPTNTYTKLGLKHTAAGINTVLSPVKLKEFSAWKNLNKVDTGFHAFTGQDGVNTVNDALFGDKGLISRAHKRYKLNGGKTSLEDFGRVGKAAWMFSFNTSEATNRMIAAAGAWSKGKAEGKVGMELKLFVEDMVRTTQHDYRVSNVPQILQGPIGGLLGQFKSWFIFETEFVSALNAEERKRFAGSLVALGGLGSIMSIPGVDIIDSASLLFSDRKISEALQIKDATVQADPESTTLSKSVSRFAAYGAPGLAGVDLTNYLGPGSLWELTRGLLGPGLSDANSLKDFLVDGTRDLRAQGRVQEDTYSRFIRSVLPSQLRRAQTAAGIVANDGNVRSPYSGKLVYQAESRAREGWAAAFGAPLADASSQRAVDAVIQRTADDYREVRGSYRKQIALAQLQGRTGDAQELITRASRAGFAFSPNDVQSALRDFSMNADERREARTPKALRNQFLDEFQTIR